jgi:exodeoxyribonuclease VII large subunit
MDISFEPKILTVAQVNEYIKALLDGDPILSDIYVKGEISNFTYHRSGHLYFTLKDETAAIKAVMFRSAAVRLKFRPENGMKVTARGRVSAFIRDGQYQLYCETLEPDGIGALYLAYEQLKAKLTAEGLFAESRKLPLPKIPLRVGIITSPTGAALRDIINITRRRFPLAELVLFPSLVQGAEAAPQLVEGIKYFSRKRSVDVIIIGRGGGSIEDLWAFNDEALARAVAACPVPVISAVGHETDFTIIDFAADWRAPTPSAAAELAVPDTAELERKILNIIGRMELLLSKRLERERGRLKQLAERRVLTSPERALDEKRMMLLSDEKRLTSAARLLISGRRTAFADYANRLESAVSRLIAAKRNAFVRSTATLEALNPMKTITRGYSAVFSESGVLIKSVSQVKPGDNISFRTSDGTVDGKVTHIRPDLSAESK